MQEADEQVKTSKELHEVIKIKLRALNQAQTVMIKSLDSHSEMKQSVNESCVRLIQLLNCPIDEEVSDTSDSEKDQYDMTFGEVPSQGYENFSGIKDEGHINAAKTFEKKNTDPFQNQSKKIKNHIVNQKFLEPA